MTLSPVDLVRVAHACEDEAGAWFGPQPSGFTFGRFDCERYVTEGALKTLHDVHRGRYTFREVWAAVAAHLDAHPEILAAGRLSQERRAELRAKREVRAKALLDDANAAFWAGDYDRADELIDAAELAAPDLGSFDRGRQAIAARRGGGS